MSYKSQLWYVIQNKQIDLITNIMSKFQGVFTENFTIFFSNAEKIENMPEFEFEKF